MHPFGALTGHAPSDLLLHLCDDPSGILQVLAFLAGRAPGCRTYIRPATKRRFKKLRAGRTSRHHEETAMDAVQRRRTGFCLGLWLGRCHRCALMDHDAQTCMVDGGRGELSGVAHGALPLLPGESSRHPLSIGRASPRRHPTPASTLLPDGQVLLQHLGEHPAILPTLGLYPVLVMERRKFTNERGPARSAVGMRFGPRTSRHGV